MVKVKELTIRSVLLYKLHRSIQLMIYKTSTRASKMTYSTGKLWLRSLARGELLAMPMLTTSQAYYVLLKGQGETWKPVSDEQEIPKRKKKKKRNIQQQFCDSGHLAPPV